MERGAMDACTATPPPPEALVNSLSTQSDPTDPLLLLLLLLLTHPTPPHPAQAKEAMSHPYFDDLDRETVDALENPALEELRHA